MARILKTRWNVDPVLYSSFFFLNQRKISSGAVFCNELYMVTFRCFAYVGLPSSKYFKSVEFKDNLNVSLENGNPLRKKSKTIIPWKNAGSLIMFSLGNDLSLWTLAQVVFAFCTLLFPWKPKQNITYKNHLTRKFELNTLILPGQKRCQKQLKKVAPNLEEKNRVLDRCS